MKALLNTNKAFLNTNTITNTITTLNPILFG